MLKNEWHCILFENYFSFAFICPAWPSVCNLNNTALQEKGRNLYL